MLSIRNIDLRICVTHGLVLLMLLGVNGWRPYKIIISNHTDEVYSPKCRVNASFDDSGRFSLNVEFLNIIRNPFLHTDIYFETDDGKYDLELLNRTVDLCKLYRNKRYEPILQVIFKLLDNYFTRWFKSCPINKGVYYLKNVELNVERLPPFFPEKSGVYDSIVLDNQERLFRIKVYFKILKTFKKN